MGSNANLPGRPRPVRRFPDTNWGTVNRAAQRGQPELMRQALGELCQSYHEPVFAFICAHVPTARRGHAEDLTQDFFCHLLNGGFERVSADRGRFRNWLLGALKHFLYSEYRFQTRQKRDLRLLTADEELLIAPGDDGPERLYLRSWARLLTRRAAEVERARYEARGEGELFHVLLPLLDGANRDDAGAAVAARFGLSPNAFQQRLSRLRRAFGETIRAEIAKTCNGPQSRASDAIRPDSDQTVEDELLALLDEL